MLLSQMNSCSFEFRNIRLQMAIITILRNDVGFAIFLIGIDDFGEGPLRFVEGENLRVDFATFIHFDSNHAHLITDR